MAAVMPAVTSIMRLSARSLISLGPPQWQRAL
jgi:hypothetical protein